MKNVSLYIPAVRPSGAPYRKGAPVYGDKDAARLGVPSLAPAGVASHFAIAGMPRGGATFVDGVRADDSRSRWLDEGLTLWMVPASMGRHEVVVSTIHGDRAVGFVDVIDPLAGNIVDGAWHAPRAIRWDMMKALPPVDPSLGGYGKTSGYLTAPSGATPDQVSQYQGTLVWLGHLPRAVSSITGRMPVAPASALRAFQANYNVEQARERYRFAPRTLTVDGQWGPATQQALSNYVASARAAGFGLGVTPAQISAAAQAAAMNPTILPTDGYGSGPGPSIAPIKADNGLAPRPAAPVTPAVRPQTAGPAAPIGPAPVIPPAASTFPVGPAIAVGVGVLAIAGALVYRSRRNKKGR